MTLGLFNPSLPSTFFTCPLVQLSWLVPTVTWMYCSQFSTMLSMQRFSYLKCPPGTLCDSYLFCRKPSPTSLVPTDILTSYVVMRPATFNLWLLHVPELWLHSCNVVFNLLHALRLCWLDWTLGCDVRDKPFLLESLRVSGGSWHKRGTRLPDLLDRLTVSSQRQDRWLQYL